MSNLSEYIEISALKENVAIVKKDGKLYVKKNIPSELTYLYKILMSKYHKNVSQIVEVFEYQDCTVVIEKYIDGDSLADILAKNKYLSENMTKNIIGQICDGLTFLHKQNIIHRDINPNNIVISSDGCVKIIDFDIARTPKKNASSDTTILGTAGYAAPEQFGFSQSDIRTDIYAVGVLANVMLTGMLPGEMTYKGRLGKIISKATAIDAGARYRKISDFKHAFTNEVDENTNCVLKVLRCIPGFRTFELWKMVIALICYMTYVPLMFLFVLWTEKNFAALSKTVLSEILMFVIPFLLLTNLSGIRRIVSRKPIRALIVSILISAVSFIIGVLILLPNFS